MSCEIEEFKEHLEFRVKDTAEWRRQKAEEYPDDARNAEASDLLSRIERDLHDTPITHPLLIKTHHLWGRALLRDEDERLHLEITERTSELTRRWGFDYAGATAEEFLTEYADLLEEALH